MKKYFLFSVASAFFSLAVFTQAVTGQTAKVKTKKVAAGYKSSSPASGSIIWTSQSAVARQHADIAINHMLNIEMPQAYAHFVEAVEADPNFTMAQAILSNLSFGESKKKYAEAALKSSANKSAGEKLFVSLLNEKNTPEEDAATWAKLFEMFPNEKMINTYYVYTRLTPEERFTAAEEMLRKHPDAGWMHNIMGYYYMNDKKDMENAKASFEKYLSFYPDGYNPYDSMGEFYLKSGDKVNAEKYYSMALEKYPFSNSAREALDGIKAGREKE